MPTFKHLGRVTVIRSSMHPDRVSLMHFPAATVAAIAAYLRDAGTAAGDVTMYELGVELRAVCERDKVDLMDAANSGRK